MKPLLIIFSVLLCFGSIRAQVPDSSALLFDETVVHEYELSFYIEDWEEALEYNYENGEEYMPARLVYNGMVWDSIGVRYKGNSSYMMSRGTPKKPLKFKFTEYRDEQTFYGIKRLNFSNCVKDPSFLREMLAYNVIRRYVPASRTAYANITAEGMLLGLYVQVEQVDKTFLERHFPDNDFNLYKAGDNGGTLEYRGESSSAYEAEYELKTNEDENDWSRFITMMRLLDTADDESFRSELEPWFDFSAAVRLLAFNMVLSNFDSYTGSGRNFYFYDEEISGGLTMLPWDLNEAFGAYTNNWNVTTQDVLSISNLEHRPLARRILENDELRSMYLAFIKEMIDGPASYDSIAAVANTYHTLIKSHVQADQYKLYSYDKFLENLDSDVVIGLNMSVPGILSFADRRNAALRTQLGVYTGIGDDTPDAAANGFGAVTLYPNPLRDVAGLQYRTNDAGQVNLTVRNLLGQEVFRRSLGERAAGVHDFQASFSSLPAGTYIYRLTLGSGSTAYQSSTSGTMVILR